jgi:hypothetical protein
MWRPWLTVALGYTGSGGGGKQWGGRWREGEEIISPDRGGLQSLVRMLAAFELALRSVSLGAPVDPSPVVNKFTFSYVDPGMAVFAFRKPLLIPVVFSLVTFFFLAYVGHFLYKLFKALGYEKPFDIEVCVDA